MPGYFSCSMATAFETLSGISPLYRAKIGIRQQLQIRRGTILNWRILCAVSAVISTSSSTEGSMFIVVSAKKEWAPALKAEYTFLQLFLRQGEHQLFRECRLYRGRNIYV